jgi:hypothetical protein
MTMAEMKELFPGVPEEKLPKVDDLPAMQNQFAEMMAVKFAFFDFLAENPSLLPQDEAARKIFYDHRLRTLGVDESGKPRLYLDAWLGKLKLTKDDLVHSHHENSLVGKLRKVALWEAENRAREEAFWKAERERRVLK